MFKFIFRGLWETKQIIYISAVAGRRSHGALARTSYPEGLWVPSSCVMELCLLAGMTQVEPRETPRLIYMRLMVTYQHRSNGSIIDSTDKATLARLAMKTTQTVLGFRPKQLDMARSLDAQCQAELLSVLWS